MATRRPLVTGSTSVTQQFDGAADSLEINGDSSITRLLLKKGADIASTGSMTWGTDGNYFHITGTTTITAFNSLAAGVRMVAEFDGALILTYNATSLILPTSANITTAAGDTAEFVSEGSGNWRCVMYARRSGAALGGGGSGDVVGPASATDNAIARFDGTGGKTLQNSAATVSDDGIIKSATNSGANTVAVPLCNWLMLTADYTLTSSASEQKYFNSPTNGTLTLPTGVYEFEWFVYVTNMSATSGNAALDPVGAGTAVTDRWGYAVYGLDNTSPLGTGTRGGSASVTQQTIASATSATTGTGMTAIAQGMFRVSTGGTIIPSITLVTAAAATAKAGSYIKIFKVGESSETFVGAWT